MLPPVVEKEERHNVLRVKPPKPAPGKKKKNPQRKIGFVHLEKCYL